MTDDHASSNASLDPQEYQSIRDWAVSLGRWYQDLSADYRALRQRTEQAERMLATLLPDQSWTSLDEAVDLVAIELQQARAKQRRWLFWS